MISQGGKKILERFVTSAKKLLTQNVTELLQQHYGIWADGHTIPVESLPNQDTDIVHTARMLRERLGHLLAALPDDKADKEKLAVAQLISEQAFTQLNRFCAVRMCEERNLIFESIGNGFDSKGFQSYDKVANPVTPSRYLRYKWYLLSVFDELSVELPAVFDRYSPYGLIFPDESTLNSLFALINDQQLSAWYDDQNRTNVNFWTEDETLGWMFQFYNSLEERQQMRAESTKPRNSREMAVRNQFFTPEYIVRFLTDNSLGRIWYEMTGGKSRIGEEQCLYMVRRPGEQLTERAIKEPTEILSLDPTCGSMHFGIYLYEVYEYIYLDAWDNQPQLLHKFRETNTRETFRREIPRLILENNIYGCEIDPRALQLAALSLWLRAQKSFDQMDIPANNRPLITRSNLVLAEAMPGNKRLLNGLMEQLDKPTQRLITKIWEKMQFVGEAGLLFKMEKEIDDEIEYLRQNWAKVNQFRYANLFSTDAERARIEAENATRKALKQNKEQFFNEITDRLQEALKQLSAQLSEDEGYENALFSDDATRGFAFIQLCQKRFDCIVMNPPFGDGSENTTNYLDDNYPTWCGNLVCAFFDRMQEMLTDDGRLGAIFDKTIYERTLYKRFRIEKLCGYVNYCADTGWGVLDANVETSNLILKKNKDNNIGVFFRVLEDAPEIKKDILLSLLLEYNNGKHIKNKIFESKSFDFANLPNAVFGYFFNEDILNLFKYPNLSSRNYIVSVGYKFFADIHSRVFYESNFDTHNIVHRYNGGSYTLFYMPYRDTAVWQKEGIVAKAMPHFQWTAPEWQKKPGVAYGKRGDIIDGHIFKEQTYFTHEGLGVTGLNDVDSRFVYLSFINSIIAQYTVNLYTGQHKHPGYVNLLPMPDYASRQTDIERIVNEIIEIKRWWFSLDETNLEYHGLVAQLNITTSVSDALDSLQQRLNADYARYQQLVTENDNLWMDLANIEPNSDFRQTLNNYKTRRPYEELLSIDGASNKNQIDKKTMAQEIVMELAGMAFGRWDIGYAQGSKPIPPFGDVFDALPFMPVVSLNSAEQPNYCIQLPQNGILTNNPDSPMNLAKCVSNVMREIWHDRADDIEYELCQLIGCRSLQAWFENPNGFFDYHFKRYTKSRRKAPIYWPLSSDDGSLTYWVYYPQMTKNTLPSIIEILRQEQEHQRSELNAAIANHNKPAENSARSLLQQIEDMSKRLSAIVNSGYIPCHDDGVPVTAAPLCELFAHSAWRNECADNLKALQKGDYDWSHLAMSLFPARITEKAKTDWCLALTHGLEHLCINKPKEKKVKKKQETKQQSFDFESGE